MLERKRVAPAPVSDTAPRRRVGAAEPSRAHGHSGIFALHRTLGNRAVRQMLSVQQRAAEGAASLPASTIHEAAAAGVATPSAPLPHLDRIQRAFGMSDLGGVRAHVGSEAAASARAMGAAAYAAGDHVVFAGTPSVRLAAHEAAHVVQQRGGIALPGAVGAAGDAYERNADAIADRVERGQSAHDLVRPFARRAGAGGGVQRQVQRAIGFEFELGNTQTFKKEEKEEKQRLPKGTVLVDMSVAGFKVTADDPPIGASKNAMSDLELITDPIDDTAKNGRAKAQAVLGAMINFLRQVGAAAAEAPDGVPADEVGGEAGMYMKPDARNSDPADGLTMGVLQASAGLNLNALINVRSGQVLKLAESMLPKKATFEQAIEVFALGDGGAADAKQAKDPAIWGYCLEGATHFAEENKLDAHDVKALAAVMSLIVTIPVLARTTKLPYPKSAAGGLLARTDLVTVLGQLPSAYRKALDTNRAKWKSIVIEIIGDVAKRNVSSSEAVFPSAFTAPNVPSLDLKLDTWLTGLATGGADMLTESYYPESKGSGQAAALESMGAFGDKMDAPKHYEAPRPVFEFRNLGAQRTQDLVLAGLAFWDYMNVVNGISHTRFG